MVHHKIKIDPKLQKKTLIIQYKSKLYIDITKQKKRFISILQK